MLENCQTIRLDANWKSPFVWLGGMRGQESSCRLHGAELATGVRVALGIVARSVPEQLEGLRTIAGL